MSRGRAVRQAQPLFGAKRLAYNEAKGRKRREPNQLRQKRSAYLTRAKRNHIKRLPQLVRGASGTVYGCSLLISRAKRSETNKAQPIPSAQSRERSGGEDKLHSIESKRSPYARRANALITERGGFLLCRQARSKKTESAKDEERLSYEQQRNERRASSE